VLAGAAYAKAAALQLNSEQRDTRPVHARLRMHATLTQHLGGAQRSATAACLAEHI
jgi:hypothetical protein